MAKRRHEEIPFLAYFPVLNGAVSPFAFNWIVINSRQHELRTKVVEFVDKTGFTVNALVLAHHDIDTEKAKAWLSQFHVPYGGKALNNA